MTVIKNAFVHVFKIVESPNVLPSVLLIIIQHNQMFQAVPDRKLTQTLKQMLQLLQTLVALQFQLSNNAVMLQSTKNSNFLEALLLISVTLSQDVKVKASAQMVASLLLNNILLHQNHLMIVMDISIVFVKKQQKMLIMLTSVATNDLN